MATGRTHHSSTCTTSRPGIVTHYHTACTKLGVHHFSHGMINSSFCQSQKPEDMINPSLMLQHSASTSLACLLHYSPLTRMDVSGDIKTKIDPESQLVTACLCATSTHIPHFPMNAKVSRIEMRKRVKKRKEKRNIRTHVNR